MGKQIEPFWAKTFLFKNGAIILMHPNVSGQSYTLEN